MQQCQTFFLDDIDENMLSYPVDYDIFVKLVQGLEHFCFQATH